MFSLKRNFAWLMTGQAVFSGLQFVVVIALARLGSAEDVGAYSLALAVTTPIVALCALGLRIVVTTDFSGMYADSAYLWLRLWGMVLAAILIVMVAGYYWEQQLAALAILVIGLGKLAESISDIYYAFAQKAEAMDRIAKSVILRAVLSTVVLVGLLWWGVSLVWVLAGYTAVWLGMLLLYDVRCVARVRWGRCISPLLLKGLAGHAFPLGIAATIYMVAHNSVRYVVEAELGLEILGQFAAVAYFMMLGQIVVNTMGQALRPRMARAFSSSDKVGGAKDFWRMLRWGVGIAIAMGVGLVVVAYVAGGWLLMLVYGGDYAALKPLLVMAGAASVPLFAGTFLGFVLTATGAYWATLLMSLMGVVVGFGSAFILVPIFGMMGAFYSVGSLGVAFCLALPLIWWRMRVR